MEQEIKLLEVGMFIFSYSNWGHLDRYEVTRITPKQAFAGDLTVKREISMEGGYGTDKKRAVVKKVGEYGSAYLQSPELLNKWREQNLILKAKRLHRNFNVSNIDKDKAQKIIALYESFAPNEVNQ